MPRGGGAAGTGNGIDHPGSVATMRPFRGAVSAHWCGGAKDPIYKEGRMVRRGVINSSLALLLFCLIGRPGAAQCPQFETLLSIAGVTGGIQNSSDQATLSVGGCVTLRVIVTRQSGATITSTDVTTSPNTRFFTDPARGSFSGANGSVFCV